MQNNLIHKEGKIKANALKLANFSFLFLVFIFLISFSSASMQVGLDGSLNEIGINFDRTPFNISEQTVNASNWWATNIGSLSGVDASQHNNVGGVLTIDETYLDSSWLKTDGSNAAAIVSIGDSDFLADLIWGNDMTIWDDTLNEDAILSMYTHDVSNAFVLTVNDAGSTDFHSGDMFQFRNGDNIFQITEELYGSYLNFDLKRTNPEIYSSTDIINFTDDDITTTGDITANNLIVGNESASASFRGLGDIYAIGSIKAMEGLYAESKAYGAGLEIMDNNVTITHHNIMTGDATLTAATKIITDTSASYTDAYEGQFFRVVSSTPSFTGATGEIIDVIDSTHLVLGFATSGTDTIVDATGMSYVIYPHPNFFVGDNGVISANIGENEDAKFEVHIHNGTGFHGVYIEDTAGADQHQAFTIDADSKTFDGIVGANIFMSTSTGADGISGSALLLEGDATGFNNSHMGFIDVNFLGQGLNNDVDIIHIQGLPPDAHIIHSGEPDDISKAYYDDGDGTTSDVTTAFTSQATDVTLFENDNSIIYIGNTQNFTSVGISFSTESNRNIRAEYYYCDSSDNWVELPGVTDTTNGMQTSGTISFVNPSDRGTCNDEIDNTNFADTTDYTYIAIKRTRNNWAGDYPIENLITISGGGEYFYLDRYGFKTDRK